MYSENIIQSRKIFSWRNNTFVGRSGGKKNKPRLDKKNFQNLSFNKIISCVKIVLFF